MSDYGTLRRHLLAIPFELVMFGGAIVTLGRGDQVHFLASVFTLAISFLPLVVERQWRVRLPIWLQTAYVAFIFGSMFSGEVFAMYSQVWIWDDWTHFISGILIGVGAILWMAFLQLKDIRLPEWLQGYVVVATAVLFAVLWELAEFTSDQLFGTTSQGRDLTDTMLDFLFNFCGVVLVAVVWRLGARRKNAGLNMLTAHFIRMQR